DSGDGDVLLLQPTQESRKPGAAPDRHDAQLGLLRSEAVRLNQVSQALARRPLVPERGKERSAKLVKAQPDADRTPGEHDEFPVRVRDELERDGLDEVSKPIREMIIAVYPSKRHRQGEARHDEPGEQEQDPALDEHAWAEPCPELHMSPCRSPAIRIRPGRIIARSRLNSGAWCRCVGTVRSAILGAGTEGARARVGDAHFNFCRAALRPT